MTSVAGRVIEAHGTTLVVADAFETTRVELTEPTEATAGDLVVVRDGAVVERFPAPAPRGDGETARFVLQAVGQRLRARSRALATIREYFASQGFVEVDTPVRVRTPGLDLHVEALSAEGGYLSTSPEHHMKRLLVGGLPRIYQLAHALRAGEHGPLHEPEFMMLEWYRAFAGQAEVMADTEAVVGGVARTIAGGTTLSVGDRNLDVTPPYERMTVREAFQRFAAIDDPAALPESRYFEVFVSEIEPALAELARPVFVCEYPIRYASLARPSPRDPGVAERFELYLAGIELCNGFGELTDAAEQRRRFERDQAERAERGQPVYAIDERLLAALEEGMPPSGGNALGVDRLVAMACGLFEIASVQPFPADWL